MSNSFKVCPQCGTPTQIDTIECSKCGRKYQSTSPLNNQTQVFSPGGLPTRLAQLRQPAQRQKKIGSVTIWHVIIVAILAYVALELCSTIRAYVDSMISHKEDQGISQSYPSSLSSDNYNGPPRYLDIHINMSLQDIQSMVGVFNRTESYKNIIGRLETRYIWQSGKYNLNVIVDDTGKTISAIVTEHIGPDTVRWREEHYQ